jgi:putative ABC transport system permease protein
MGASVERQVILPWKQVIRIAFNSLRVRLFRSLITTFTLVLAIAFVAYLWSGYEMLNSVWPSASQTLQEDIQNAGYEPSHGQFGASAKDRWLAILSLLVCVVGIINAQLMAVTERFREIGTFKCLGALDSFVVKIFVLEAAYQGMLGGLAGAVLGALVATVSMTLHFGWTILAHWPVVSILYILLTTTLLAVLLSFLGVIYPALVAARMQPAVALRSEE